MVLGVPILDVAVVIINRVRRRQSPLHYDKTHLHHRLMATGLSVKQICWVIYGLSIVFGLLALMLSGIHYAHFYKFVGVGLVGITMAVMIAWIDYRQRQRGVRIKLDGPEPTPTPSNGQEIAPAANDDGIYDTTGDDQAEANEASQPRRNVLRADELQARLPH
jgi:UDP-GlcNAc:undecaprenyl-phosphate/decaprenyl-phosphate GlcNAc-1-phosphate transferase